MSGFHKHFVNNISLAGKIRISYIAVVAPILAFTMVCLVALRNQNMRYDRVIDAAGRASEFSLDFKKDFDYETYLVIVESKSFEESELKDMLSDATKVVDSISNEVDLSQENERRLEDIRKYLKNLGTYSDRIEENLRIGDRYEDNIEIWENDVQIVTGLVRETILQFIYYEIQDLHEVRREMNAFYARLFSYSVIALIVVTLLVIVISYGVSHSITKPVIDLSKVTEKVARDDRPDQ